MLLSIIVLFFSMRAGVFRPALSFASNDAARDREAKSYTRSGFACSGQKWFSFLGLGVALITCLYFVFFASPVWSQSAAVMKRGDGVVTAFSGTKLKSPIPKGVHPLDVTFIDPKSASLRVFDLSRLGGPASGQEAEALKKLSITAQEIGQVFGVTLDRPDDGVAPNIYAAATSFYGLQIVGKRNGKHIRLVNGEPGAKWMRGQFAVRNGGGPGTIWKIDGKSGAVSLFAKIKSGPNDNAGPGLGGLAYDYVTRQVYVPSLETGFIHHIDKDGKDLGFFDHGIRGRALAELDAVAYDPTRRMSIEDPNFSIEKPQTWGFADERRLVVAVAVQGNRLYYSVASGPQVWSVGLDSKGGFVNDARLEIDLSDATENGWVTGISFDGPSKIYLTQRGVLEGSYDYKTFARAQNAAVIQYTWDEEDASWSFDSQEFAVGLNSPYRASNGGLALGYGYDKRGRLKSSSCNATLWITGDHLRDGADGGVLSGLQGIATSRGQTREIWHPSSGSSALKSGLSSTEVTNLEPPAKSWFVDLDGKTKDSDAFGQIGALAIHTPDCEPDSAPTRPDPVDEPLADISWPDFFEDDLGPDDFPPWGNPPIGFPGLDIKKSCAPAAFGGVFKCTITVKNTGTLPFLFPITVSDATTIAAGPGAGGAQSIAAVTPDGPEWTCTPTPSINLSCGLKPEHLLPGVSRSFVVDIDTSDMVADGNVGFTNCASLGAPYWGIACDHAGSDITVKKTAEPGCIAGGNCTYNLEITNGSSSPFNGQLQLSDEMFIGIGGALNAPIVAIAGDLGCAGGDPAAIPFSCLSTMNLAAGETRMVALTATMPAAPPNYWARNCFAATAPGVVPGDLSTTMPPGGGSLGAGGAVGCAWMAVGAPGPHSNLKFNKTAQFCGKLPGDPDTVKCDYTISITNTGPTDFNTPITFDETVDPAATLIFNDPAWTCALGPPTYTCNSAGAVAIAANETISIPVSVTTPKAVVEANTCYVPNTVTLSAPPLNPATNYLAGDDTAQADGDAFLLEFLVNGAAVILCDPTNLKTTKVSKGPCEKSGAKWRCEFGIEVENTGPDPYKGRIEVLDIMSIAPTSVTFSGTPGWSRTPAVGHDVYRLPLRTLQKGDKVNLNVTLEIPDGSYCSLRNTAYMSFPTLKRHNGDKTDDTSEVIAKIPRPECHKPPVCKPKRGEIRTSSGACACKENATRGKDGLCKVATNETQPTPKPELEPEPESETPINTENVCPDGYPVPRNGICPCRKGKIWDRYLKKCVNDDDDRPSDTVSPDPDVPVMPLCRLRPGQIRTSGNRCVCANGRKWNPRTYCKPKPCTLLPGQIRTKDNRCVCANGRKWNKKTYCEHRTPSCRPRPGEVIIKGTCKCANGRKWNAKTYCDPPAKTCPNADTYLAAPGVCCLIGQVYRNGKCRRPGPTCAKPRHINKFGTCVCGHNKVYNARKNTCHNRVPSGPQVTCSGGSTVFHAPTGLWGCRCPKGKHAVKAGKNAYRCVKNSDPASDCKAKGWRWTGRTCIRPTDPAKVCRHKGWTWTGKNCIQPLSPAQKCKRKGWNWTGKGCIRPLSPAQKCKRKGWNWTGKRCIRPLSPAQRCKRKGWRWTGKRCIKPVRPCPKGTVGPGQPNCKKITIYKKAPTKLYIPKKSYQLYKKK